MFFRRKQNIRFKSLNTSKLIYQYTVVEIIKSLIETIYIICIYTYTGSSPNDA